MVRSWTSLACVCLAFAGLAAAQFPIPSALPNPSALTAAPQVQILQPGAASLAVPGSTGRTEAMTGVNTGRFGASQLPSQVTPAPSEPAEDPLGVKLPAPSSSSSSFMESRGGGASHTAGAAAATAGSGSTTATGALAPAASNSSGVINHDSSPVCMMNLATCEEKCAAPQTFIYMCAAGNGPEGTPLVTCQCVAPAQPAGLPSQVAKVQLVTWPGSQACNSKTWINDCTSTMTITVQGSDVTMKPGVSAFSNENCAEFQGKVLGPKGLQAAMALPGGQYPIGLTSTGPDGSVQIDFATQGASDPMFSRKDWSQCIVTYKIIQGGFLNPPVGNQRAIGAAAAGTGASNGAGSGRKAAAALPVAVATVVLALLAPLLL